jgi:hypothetical protein
MKHNFDLLQENKKLRAEFVKTHIRIRKLANSDNQRFLLAKIWGEIGFDNVFFWKTVYRNLGLLPWITAPALKELYDLAQEWYHQWRVQDFNKDEWLNFVTMDYGDKKKDWNDFWVPETFKSR